MCIGIGLLDSVGGVCGGGGGWGGGWGRRGLKGVFKTKKKKTSRKIPLSRTGDTIPYHISYLIFGFGGSCRGGLGLGEREGDEGEMGRGRDGTRRGGGGKGGRLRGKR